MNPATPVARRQLAAARRKARHYAVQALYQWAMAGTSPGDIEQQFHEDFDFRGTDDEYFHALVHGVPAVVGELDACMSPFLDIPLEKLGPVEHAVLRVGSWELRERLDVPWRVVIDEAVALSKRFGATDSHRFVNAVLDRVARELRRAELHAH
jgi:N utilization substance protein B